MEPVRPPFRELRPPEAEHEYGRLAEPGCEEFNQVEEGRFRPVDVIEHGDNRALGGKLVEQTSGGGEDFVGGAPRQLVLAASGLPKQLAQRPKCDPFTVGWAAADEHGRLRREPGQQLPSEPRLADTRLTHERDNARPRAAHDLRVEAVEQLELALAADQRCVVTVRQGRRLLVQRLEPISRHLAPISPQRFQQPRVDSVCEQGVRRLADQDLAGSGSLLEPRADCDWGSGERHVALTGTAGDDLPRLDPDPNL